LPNMGAKRTSQLEELRRHSNVADEEGEFDDKDIFEQIEI